MLWREREQRKMERRGGGMRSDEVRQKHHDLSTYAFSPKAYNPLNLVCFQELA